MHRMGSGVPQPGSVGAGRLLPGVFLGAPGWMIDWTNRAILRDPVLLQSDRGRPPKAPLEVGLSSNEVFELQSVPG
jgi:hypothetical protein